MVTSFCTARPGNIFLHLGRLAVLAWGDNGAVLSSARYNSYMKRLFASSLLFLSLLGPVGGVSAQQGYWRDLPPDERRQMRQQMREHWQQEREIRRDEPPPRWRDIPPEDRRRLRDDMREQRGLQEAHGFHGRR